MSTTSEQKVIFYRYRRHWASGTGSWEYSYYVCSEDDSENILKERQEELDLEYDWSDKYRGSDFESLHTLSNNLIDGFIKKQESVIKASQEIVNLLKKRKTNA